MKKTEMMIHKKKNLQVTSLPEICFDENKELKVMAHDSKTLVTPQIVPGNIFYLEK